MGCPPLGGLGGLLGTPGLRQPCAGCGCNAQSRGFALARTDPAPFSARPLVSASRGDAREGAGVQMRPG